MDYTLLIGNTAVVCTIASNFAGLSVCLDILRRKSTSGVSSLPFLSAAICTLLWLQYGFAIRDNALIAVNAVAVCMQSSYLACYYHVTPDKAFLGRRIVLGAAFLLSVYGYSFQTARSRAAVQHSLGLLSSGSSVVTSAVPVTMLKEVFQTRSTKNLPFPIIFGTFVVSTLWCLYGVLINDPFVKIPNFIGALLSGLQLSLFFIFDSKKPPLKSD